MDDALLWLSKADSETGVGSFVSGGETHNRLDAGGDNNGNSWEVAHGNGNAPLSKEEVEAHEARELLIRELGNAIRNDSKNLEKEWLGVDLEEEWNLIKKYNEAGKDFGGIAETSRNN